jgi:hypothetical protein
MSCRRLPRRLGTAPARADNDDLFNAQAKCYIQLIIFTPSISFVDLLYMLLSALPIPLDMLGGLTMLTRRSPDLRVQIFYLVLCSPPLDMLGGLALPI